MDDSISEFTSDILSGKKTIETRTNRLLDDFKGKQVGLLKKINGKRYLMGFVTIADADAKVYDGNTKEGLQQWRADGKKHRVVSGTKYDIAQAKKGIKYGYALENPVKLDSPIAMPDSTKGEFTGRNLPESVMAQVREQLAGRTTSERMSTRMTAREKELTAENKALQKQGVKDTKSFYKLALIRLQERKRTRSLRRQTRSSRRRTRLFQSRTRPSRRPLTRDMRQKQRKRSAHLLIISTSEALTALV